jgi:hypothetical protein
MAQANAWVSDDALDGGPDYVIANGADVWIIDASLAGVPVSLSEASTYKLGQKTGITVTGPTNGDASGRKCTIPAITDGSVLTTGTVGAFALLTTGGTSLILAQDVATNKAVNSGEVWTGTETDFTVPDPTT